MKPKYAVALGVLFGVALSATAIKGLNAQNPAPAYLVIDITEMTDPDSFNAALTANSAASTAELGTLGGRYVVRTMTATTLDGTPPKRLVIVAFDNTEKAKAWYNSPKTSGITAARLKATKSSAYIVDGSVN
jgi:uncharacterized protein (DUF1330 family)